MRKMSVRKSKMTLPRSRRQRKQLKQSPPKNEKNHLENNLPEVLL
jgi:hypothetical protein